MTGPSGKVRMEPEPKSRAGSPHASWCSKVHQGHQVSRRRWTPGSHLLGQVPQGPWAGRPEALR